MAYGSLGKLFPRTFNIRLASCVISVIQFSCKICARNIHEKDKAVQCDLYKLCIHIKCNNLNYLYNRYLQNCDECWHCIECCNTSFPLNSLSNENNFLACCTSKGSNIMHWKDLANGHNRLLKRSLNLELLVNQSNNATSEKSNNPEIISSSKS